MLFAIGIEMFNGGPVRFQVLAPIVILLAMFP